jgi:hypothetical protein
VRLMKEYTIDLSSLVPPGFRGHNSNLAPPRAPPSRRTCCSPCARKGKKGFRGSKKICACCLSLPLRGCNQIVESRIWKLFLWVVIFLAGLGLAVALLGGIGYLGYLGGLWSIYLLGFIFFFCSPQPSIPASLKSSSISNLPSFPLPLFLFPSSFLSSLLSFLPCSHPPTRALWAAYKPHAGKSVLLFFLGGLYSLMRHVESHQYGVLKFRKISEKNLN